MFQVLPNPHRDNITNIVPLPIPNRPGNQGGGGKLEVADGRFLSVCKDGTVCFWRSNYTLQRMVQVRLVHTFSCIRTSLIRTPMGQKKCHC